MASPREIPLRVQRASRQAVEVPQDPAAAPRYHRARCIWLTGLSGSGKSTIANLLEKRLRAEGRRAFILDGDDVRRGLSRDLGFSEADRVENIRRIAEVAKLMTDSGLVVLVSCISPFRAGRQAAREMFERGEFLEVFVDAPLVECERRDPKGLYARVRRGELRHFTGVDSKYEPPEEAEVHLRSGEDSPEVCAEHILMKML